MRLEERYRRLDTDTMGLTMIDSVVYAEPFESDRKIFELNRERSNDWDEQACCIPEEELAFQRLIGLGNLIDCSRSQERNGVTLTAGTKLGPYEIHRLLGAGGLGEVYSTTDTRLDRMVAMKFFPASGGRPREAGRGP